MLNHHVSQELDRLPYVRDTPPKFGVSRNLGRGPYSKNSPIRTFAYKNPPRFLGTNLKNPPGRGGRESSYA